MLDQEDAILLVRFRDGRRSWWCLPGGGVEEGETDAEAAMREIREETGYAELELGQLIWIRRDRGIFRGRAFDQMERIYVAHVPRFDPRHAGEGLPEHEVSDMRWWSTAELAATSDDLAPARLPTLLRELLELGPPSVPLDVGR
jgi:ADP-ribose pyrophosphatase YjhB (NUDIX family)